MIKSKKVLHVTIILSFFIFMGALVAAQFYPLNVQNLDVYQAISLVKALVCSSIFLYWLFIRYSAAAVPLFSLFKTWQIAMVIVLQSVEGGYVFFSSEQGNWPLAIGLNLFAVCLLYLNLYLKFLSKRLADLVVISLVSVSFFIFIGYTYESTDREFILSSDLPLILFSAFSCSVLLAVGLIRIQFKLNQYSEFELLPLLIMFSGFLTLIAGQSAVLWGGATLLQVLFLAVLVSLIVKVDKYLASDWSLLSSGLNTSKNAYFYCSEHAEIRFINDAFKTLFGIKPGTRLDKVKHPLHTHPLSQTINDALSSKGYWSGETVIVAENGNVVSVHIEFKVLEVNGERYHQGWFLDLAEKIELQTNEHAIQEKLERLSFSLMDKQEDERRYFAKELHDEIGQGLTLLKIQHQLPEPDKDLIKSVLSELIDKVRNLSLNLRPSILDDMGLSAALEWLTDRQRKFSQLAIVSDITPGIPRFNDKFEISVFRIAQEAFTNIHKYSHADLVTITCSIEHNYLQLIIEDNGVGFDVSSKLNSAIKGQSLGLLSIQERAFLINGLIDISSTPELGTVITLRVPVSDNVLGNSDVTTGQNHELF